MFSDTQKLRSGSRKEMIGRQGQNNEKCKLKQTYVK